MDISDKDAADLFSRQTGIINSLWQNYSAVTGVLIGVGVSGFNHSLSIPVRIAASIAFAMFSQGNMVLLRQACKIHVAVRDVVRTRPCDEPGEKSSYGRVLATMVDTANPPNWAHLYHHTIDLAVFASIWLPSAFG